MSIFSQINIKRQDFTIENHFGESPTKRMLSLLSLNMIMIMKLNILFLVKAFWRLLKEKIFVI